jgi:hypothetical protein
MRVVKAHSATPQVTPSPLDEADDDIQEVPSDMDKLPTRSQQQKLKQRCLKRDGFRCMLSGLIDVNYHETQPSLIGGTGDTELAHIIPFSMGAWGNAQQVCISIFFDNMICVYVA